MANQLLDMQGNPTGGQYRGETFLPNQRSRSSAGSGAGNPYRQYNYTGSRSNNDVAYDYSGRRVRQMNQPNWVSEAEFASPAEIVNWFRANMGRNPQADELAKALIMPKDYAFQWLGQVMGANGYPSVRNSTQGQTGWHDFNEPSQQQTWSQSSMRAQIGNQLVNFGALFQRYYDLQNKAVSIFGEELDPVTMAEVIKRRISDDQLLYGWRRSERYQQMYVDKPTGMTESDYMTAKQKMDVEQEKVRRYFQDYGGRTLNDTELHQIYFGGPESAPIRQEWTRVQAAASAGEANRGKLFNTSVKLTPLGPVQPELGINLSAGAANVAASPATLPLSELYSTYQDYQQGNVNPSFLAPPATARAKAIEP